MKRSWIGWGLAAFAGFVAASGAGAAAAVAACPQAEEAAPKFSGMQGILDAIVADGETPAAFAACGGSTGEDQIFASGTRRAGFQEPATVDDLVHIGSCTKAMTSVMIARLVERGRLDWDDTIGGRWPELAAEIDPAWHGVTLRQLLSHTARVPRDARNWAGRGNSLGERRWSILTANLKQPPAPDAEEWGYSNLGYMLAAEVAARVEGLSAEELLDREVFQPLGMTSAGFGPPGDRERPDQPWGHRPSGDGKWSPLYFDNPPPLGPAGRVHLNLRDWLAFTKVFVGGGPAGYLGPETLTLLTTPIKNDYALGWAVVERPWGRGRVLTHGGSNTVWMSVCWVAPSTGRSYLAVINRGGDDAGTIADRIVGQLIGLDRKARERRDVSGPAGN